MLSSRGVLSLMAVAAFGAALIALRLEAPTAAVWLLTLGSGLATVWSALSMAWAETNPSMAPADSYLALTVMGVVTTMYFGLRARGASSRW